MRTLALVVLVTACAGQPKPASVHGRAGVVSLVSTMVVQPEHEQEFLALAASYAAHVHATTPGVLLYTLSKDSSAPYTYVWVERYVDDAAIAAKAATPEYKAAKAQVLQWLSRPPEGRHLVQVVPQ